MKYLLLIVAMLCFLTSNAKDEENYRFLHYTINNGLPNSIIHCIYQGNKGFLWIGTNNGLARFDGYEFKVYLPIPFNENSISHKAIENIIQDNDNKLWLLSQSNTIDCLDPVTGKIEHYPGFSSSLASADRKSTSVLFKDKKGNIWIGSNNGVRMFSSEKKIFRNFNKNWKKKIGKVYSICEDKNHTVFIGSEEGLFSISPEDYKVSQIPGNTILDSVPISNVLVDKDNLLWVTTYKNGNYCINTTEFNFIDIPTSSLSSVIDAYESRKGDIYLLSIRPKNSLLIIKKEDKQKKQILFSYFEKDFMAEFYNFNEDSSGNVWFSASNGLFKIDGEHYTLHKFCNNPSITSSIADNSTGPLFIDKTNVLWIGIYKQGIDKLDLNQKPFHFLTKKNEKDANSLPDNNILSVLEDKHGNIWMGTYNSGLTVKSKKRGDFFAYCKSTDGQMQEKTISALLEDRNGTIWAGSFYGGICLIDPVKKNVIHLNKNSNPSFKASIIRKIIEDREGNIWMATTSHGLVEYKPSTKQFYYHSEKNDRNYLDYGFYRTCFNDSRGRIWVGTQSGGVLLFDKNGNLLKRFQYNPDKQNSIINNTVYSFFEDDSGKIWIGTASGLDIFNEATGEFKHYTTQNGLPNNTIYSIIQDTSKNIWMNTDYGLCAFNIQNNSFKSYYDADGLLSIDFNSTASFKGKNNMLYFGTSKGLLYFNPATIKPNPYPSDPVISGLKIFNKEINPGEKIHNKVVLDKEIAYSSKITLTYNEYLFSLAFSTLNFSSNGNVKYQYRLEPFDKGWFLTSSSQRWVTYSNLKPGLYTFRVKASNSDGEWSQNSKEATLEIEILPPFWVTWWFRSLMIFALCGGAGLVYYSRVKSYQMNQKKLELLVANRTRMWEESNIALEEQKHEILLQKEKLEINNKLLRDQQDRILHQNIELDTHRHHLEQMVEDRTKELKEAREKAEESSRLKSAFLANMSHEIRTPMNAIVGFSNLISANEYPDDQKKEFINIIRKNSEALLVIIDDILDLSKIQSKQLMIVPKPFELKPLLIDIHRSYQVAVGEKKLELHLNSEIVGIKDELYTDPVRLKQILLNLINNAIKFTDEGSISFGVSKIESEFLHFYVKDTGHGIPAEWHEAIFERFIKVSNSQSDNQHGAGLGLAISKSLVELLGGRIWFETEIEKGTCFHFTIPNFKTPSEQKIDSPKYDNTEIDKLLKNKKILIVEDEEANYKILHAFLKIKQVIVVRVINGLEALELLKEQTDFDAILMDIRMPVMDGTTAFKNLREFNASVPVIAQTAYATIEERAEFEAIGFNDYLVKPLSQSELYQALYKVLKK